MLMMSSLLANFKQLSFNIDIAMYVSGTMAGTTSTAAMAMAVLLSQQNSNLNLLISIFPEIPSIFNRVPSKS